MSEQVVCNRCLKLVNPIDTMQLTSTYICLGCLKEHGWIDREYQTLVKVSDGFGHFVFESRPPSLLIPDKTYQSLIINDLAESRQ